MDRSNTPGRGTMAGMAAFSIDRCLSIDGDRRRCSRSGVEDHRASTFPRGIAPERDFAPTPIASDTSCRGHCRPPCLESTRVTGEAACAAGASKALAARGRCGARFPRRNPASFARGAFRRKVVRERELTLFRCEPVRALAPAPFSLRGTPREGRSPGPLQLGLSMREDGERPVID